MSVFSYTSEREFLCKTDLSRYFNRNRVNKYIIDNLTKLNKTDIKNYKVLEPGCGGGDKLRFFTEFGAQPENCYGIDVSESAIDLCKRLSPTTMNFQQGSAMDLPYPDNYFDIVVCSGLFGCFQNDGDVKRLATQINRVLKQDGVLMIVDLNHHFLDFYGSNEAVLAKNLRGYHTEEQELERLLVRQFRLIRQAPIFAIDVYLSAQQTPMDIETFPLIDYQIDQGAMRCSYSFWTFVKQ